MELKQYVEFVLVFVVLHAHIGEVVNGETTEADRDGGGGSDGTYTKSKEKNEQLRKKIKEMFFHAYNNYMVNAYPADELMPLSCQGRYRGRQPSRGDIDDILGNFSLTLIDTLDTLAVLGEVEEFEKAVRLVISDVTFDTDIVVSVFETNIRVLGGLLGGHVMAQYFCRSGHGLAWYDDQLLKKALDLGHRLLPAFNTSTGMPYPRVNLRYGVKHGLSRTGTEKDTCTACAGTMILEFSALSRLSGQIVFEEKAQKAMEYLWKSRNRASDLVGTVINIHNGDWVRRDSGVGAGIDSYYEYLIKAYILLGDDTYLDRFNTHYSAIMRYISQGPMMVDVHMHKPHTNSRNFMDALLAFWPGVQVLKGDLKPAIETHEMLYQVMQRHNFLPEAFTTDFRVHWAHHPLRPEFLESTYFLYKATGDSHYLKVGEQVLDNLEKYARVPCGFAGFKDVTSGTHEDQMDSFVLAETFKYLYLLFSDKEDLILDVDNYIFTTEAHLLPLSLSLQGVSQSNSTLTRVEVKLGESDYDDEYSHACPNTNHFLNGHQNYVDSVRSPLKDMVGQGCPAVSGKQSRALKFRGSSAHQYKASSNHPRLRASEFMAGNQQQLQQLQRMGIRIVTMSDGRVQLLHTSTEAASTEEAEDGMLFMQEMIELSKTQTQQVQQEPRVVQFMTPPYFGHVVLNAGPAQFGMDLSKDQQVHGRLVIADPIRACKAVHNDIAIQGHIVIVERGECMFVDKARLLEGAGAAGVIVIDNTEGTSNELQPLFSMSGDGRNDVTIPVVFLFYTEGQKLLNALKTYDFLQVFLGYQAMRSEEIMQELLKDQEEKERIRFAHSADNIKSNEEEEEEDELDMAESKETKIVVLNKEKQIIQLGGISIEVHGSSSSSPHKMPQQTETDEKSVIHLDIKTDGGLGTKEVSKALDELVTQLSMYTNFNHIQGQQDSFVLALGKMIEAMVSGNYNKMDPASLASLEKLTKELKPQATVVTPQGVGATSQDSDPEDEESEASVDTTQDDLTLQLHQVLDNYIDHEVNKVLKEASKDVEPIMEDWNKDIMENEAMKTNENYLSEADDMVGPVSPNLAPYDSIEELELPEDTPYIPSGQSPDEQGLQDSPDVLLWNINQEPSKDSKRKLGVSRTAPKNTAEDLSQIEDESSIHSPTPPPHPPPTLSESGSTKDLLHTVPHEHAQKDYSTSPKQTVQQTDEGQSDCPSDEENCHQQSNIRHLVDDQPDALQSELTEAQHSEVQQTKVHQSEVQEAEDEYSEIQQAEDSKNV